MLNTGTGQVDVYVASGKNQSLAETIPGCRLRRQRHRPRKSLDHHRPGPRIHHRRRQSIQTERLDLVPKDVAIRNNLQPELPSGSTPPATFSLKQTLFEASGRHTHWRHAHRLLHEHPPQPERGHSCVRHQVQGQVHCGPALNLTQPSAPQPTRTRSTLRSVEASTSFAAIYPDHLAGQRICPAISDTNPPIVVASKCCGNSHGTRGCASLPSSAASSSAVFASPSRGSANSSRRRETSKLPGTTNDPFGFP